MHILNAKKWMRSYVYKMLFLNLVNLEMLYIIMILSFSQCNCPVKPVCYLLKINLLTFHVWEYEMWFLPVFMFCFNHTELASKRKKKLNWSTISKLILYTFLIKRKYSITQFLWFRDSFGFKKAKIWPFQIRNLLSIWKCKMTKVGVFFSDFAQLTFGSQKMA